MKSGVRKPVMGHLPDDGSAVNERERQQADAGKMFHAQQGSVTEFSMTK